LYWIPLVIDEEGVFTMVFLIFLDVPSDANHAGKVSREVEEKKMEIGVLKVRLEKAELDYERK
jgi:hypothetical protein